MVWYRIAPSYPNGYLNYSGASKMILIREKERYELETGYMTVQRHIHTYKLYV